MREVRWDGGWEGRWRSPVLECLREGGREVGREGEVKSKHGRSIIHIKGQQS